VSNRLAEDARYDSFGRTFHELERKWTTDAEAHEEELPNAEVIHKTQLVGGERTPRVIYRDGAAGLAAVRVALVHRDAAKVVLELLHCVEHLVRPVADQGVQPAAGC